MQPKPCQGTFAQMTKDPLSFPKAKGASTFVDLGMNSLDREEKGKTGPLCGTGTRRYKG